MTDLPSIRDVLDFWFLPLDDPEHGKPRDIWWKSTPEFDSEVRARFGAAVDGAIAGDLDTWRRSPDGALALILLCDQFARNMHRRTTRAFAGDPKALETARFALAHGYPPIFSRHLRQFFFTPFHHSESLADQELSCALMAALHDEETTKYAQEHRDVVARFGRFPHRNEVLGRTCTAEELEYLKDAQGYGQ
ncbi:MAG: DUF924 domain-containing protein [Alphaproteobacteria bacterium]|nr:DUF924 domain-containing protein [Alphaproteobacteria bacterium]MBV8408108.1 DUF924 domain-containing protein [Alphaproteobacteria bacterium]